MPIKEVNGKRIKYLEGVYHPPAYTKQIQFVVDGSPCFREEIIQPDPVNNDQTDLASAGWHEELTYKEIARQTVYKPIEGSMSFRKTQTIILSTYLVKPDRTDALLKIMPSGVYLRQFREKGDFTISYFLSSNQIKAGNFILLSEKEVDAKTASRMIESQECCCLDLGLRKDLGCDRI